MNRDVFIIMNKLGGPGWGGAHRVSAIIANYLVEKGYSVNIIVWDKIQIDYPINDKVKIIDLNIKQNSELARIKACLETRKILKKNKEAFVYILMSRIAVDVFLSTLFMKLKIIASERTDPNSEPKKKIFRIIRNQMFKYMYKTVYQTNDAKLYFPKKAQKNGIVIPNPLTPNLPKAYHGEREKVFVTYGRIDKQKNLKMMIDAFVKSHEKHENYILEIYGNGLEKENIKKYIEEKKASDYIKMYNFSKNIHEQILKKYAYLSSSDYEGMSNSMLEALAIGLPCICTDCPIGGAKMMIKDGVNGMLVPVENSQAMTEKINELIENKELCAKLSQNSVHIREELDQEKICEKWEELMK